MLWLRMSMPILTNISISPMKAISSPFRLTLEWLSLNWMPLLPGYGLKTVPMMGKCIFYCPRCFFFLFRLKIALRISDLCRRQRIMSFFSLRALSFLKICSESVSKSLPSPLSDHFIFYGMRWLLAKTSFPSLENTSRDKHIKSIIDSPFNILLVFVFGLWVVEGPKPARAKH